MPTVTVDGRKEFFYTYMRFHAIESGFSAKEAAVAGEFLYFRNRYLNSPLKEMVEEVDDNDQLIVVEKDMTMMQQLKDKRTLNLMVKNLEMSFVVFRAYVKSLVEKEFFVNGEINKKYIPPRTFKTSFNLRMKV